MKTHRKSGLRSIGYWALLIGLLSAAASSVRADDPPPCPGCALEPGWRCYDDSPGVTGFEGLSYYYTDLCQGEVAPPPPFIYGSPHFQNGTAIHVPEGTVCDVRYSTNLYFSPAFFIDTNTPGTYTFTLKLDSGPLIPTCFPRDNNIVSPCKSFSTNLFTFTVRVWGKYVDSDYDGLADCYETEVGTYPTIFDSYLPIRLGYWRFDNTNVWNGDGGQLPFASNNIVGVKTFVTNGLQIDSLSPSLLKYRDVEPFSPIANITLLRGSARFWFKPHWDTSCGVIVTNPLVSTNSFNFNITKVPSGSYWKIYASTDLTNWTFSGTVHLDSSGNGSFTDSNAGGRRGRFYQARNDNSCSRTIGFIRTWLAPYENLISNPFDAFPDNTLNTLFPSGSVLDGTRVEQFNGNKFTNTSGAWLPNGVATINPGGGTWFYDPKTNSTIIGSQLFTNVSLGYITATNGFKLNKFQFTARTNSYFVKIHFANRDVGGNRVAIDQVNLKTISGGLSVTVTNGSFEQSFTNWIHSVGAYVSGPFTSVQGNYCCLLSNLNSDIAQIVEVSPGTHYEVSFYSAADAIAGQSTTGQVQVELLDCLTFTGLLREGTFTNFISHGFNLVSSFIPLEGGITSKLGYNSLTEDSVSVWDPEIQNFHSFTYYNADDADPDPAGWYDGSGVLHEPFVGFGESFFAFYTPTGSTNVWVQQFSSTYGPTNFGPRADGRLIEVRQSTNALHWWTLKFDTNGSQCVFVTKGGATITTNLTSSVNWVSNQWHQIVLTYTPTSSLIYLDGALAASGSGVVNYPDTTERADGFSIGSDRDGNNKAKGVFDELETFNYPLSPADIANDYTTRSTMDSDGDGLPDVVEDDIGTDPHNPDTNGNGLLDGWEFWHGSDPNAPVAPGEFRIFITKPSNQTSIP